MKSNIGTFLLAVTIILLSFVIPALAQFSSPPANSLGDYPESSMCDFCGERPAVDGLYSEDVGWLCGYCAASGHFIYCRSCDQLSEYHEPYCAYGLCENCTDKLTRYCGLCEDARALREDMVHIYGCYICKDCISFLLDEFGSSESIRQYLAENYVFFPEFD